MGSFVDEYMPPQVPGYPCISAPRFKTSIQVTAGGNERRNREWVHPLHKFILPDAEGRQWPVVDALMKHWRVMGGPECSWPWRDPLDFASRDLLEPNVAPPITEADQLIGVGDGFTDSFALVKRYEVGSRTYDRPIYLPVLDTVLIAIDGVVVDPADYTVSRPGGIVQFATPPGDTLDITAGYLFDVEVRFESDEAIEGILQTYRVGGFADITLIEVRPC